VCIYEFKKFIPWSTRIATLSAIALVVLFLVPGGDYLCGFPAAYLTIYLGLLNPSKVWFLKRADYSYGIYLYGFAIQQTVAQFGPWARHWYINLPISLVAACMFAALSWHLVEKPALSLKKYLPALEESWVRFRALVWRPKSPKSENAVT
jgi:peptidoglycan/LPS O-acetylase OafA/YrhL